MQTPASFGDETAKIDDVGGMTVEQTIVPTDEQPPVEAAAPPEKEESLAAETPETEQQTPTASGTDEDEIPSPS